MISQQVRNLLKHARVRARCLPQPRRLQAAVLYRGPSMLDGRPIVVVAVNTTSRDKSNGKTGPVLQTYILVDGMDPREAIRLGYDGSICGNCRHMGDKPNGKGRTCYVNIGQGVLIVYKAFERGVYTPTSNIVAMGRGRIVRLGTYGDPAAVPFYIWQQLLSECAGHLGYTHQWKRAPHLAGICMASVDTDAEAAEATALGFRYFFVDTTQGLRQRLKSEARCPASNEAKAQTNTNITCADCMNCGGKDSGRRGNVVIQAHGGTATMANVRRRFQNIPVIVSNT